MSQNFRAKQCENVIDNVTVNVSCSFIVIFQSSNVKTLSIDTSGWGVNFGALFHKVWTSRFQGL